MLTDSHGSSHLHGIVLPEGIEKDVFVVDGRITFQPQENATTLLKSGYILPGLVDAHAHLALASPARGGASEQEQVRASARAQLEAGVLAIREPGSPNYLSEKIGPQEGLPRLFTAGRFLAPRGRYFPGLAREVDDARLPEAAEEEAKRGNGWVKVIGDFTDSDGRLSPNYKLESLTKAVQRVHALGARIAVHATSPEIIGMVIEAGFDSIEHGMGIREDHLAAMSRRRIVLVPTLVILEQGPHFLPHLGLTHDELEQELGLFKKQPEMVRRAFEAGVTILAGTDAGLVAHGLIAKEIHLLREAGLPQEAALAAGSWEARRYLGLPCIEEGAPADITAYPDDPRGDPEVLLRPLLRMLGDFAH
jgi:imidazolonepropionase-like amidohydrolase